MDGHFAAAVETCLQRASDTNKLQSHNCWPVSDLYCITEAIHNSLHNIHKHSLLLDLERRRVSDTARVQLRLAAVPQVDDGLVDIQQDHGGSGAQAAAVRGHLQQVALHWHLTPHTVQAPFAWTQTREWMQLVELLLSNSKNTFMTNMLMKQTPDWWVNNKSRN